MNIYVVELTAFYCDDYCTNLEEAFTSYESAEKYVNSRSSGISRKDILDRRMWFTDFKTKGDETERYSIIEIELHD